MLSACLSRSCVLEGQCLISPLSSFTFCMTYNILSVAKTHVTACWCAFVWSIRWTNTYFCQTAFWSRQCHAQSACKSQCVIIADLMHQLQRNCTPTLSAICCWQPLIESIQPCHLRQCQTQSIMLALHTLNQLQFLYTAASRRKGFQLVHKSCTAYSASNIIPRDSLCGVTNAIAA